MADVNIIAEADAYADVATILKFGGEQAEALNKHVGF